LSEEHIQAVRNAIGIAERFAAGEVIDVEEAGAAARAAGEAANAVQTTAAVFAATAAADAALATVHAARTTADAIAYGTCAAANGATYAATATDAERDVVEATRADYERLLSLDLGEAPGLGTPIDCSETGPLGPLWPQVPRI
jgi:hypothetical protein